MSVSDAGNSTDEQHKAKVSAINALKLILHKNRSLTRIRLEDYEGAEFDCNKGLKTINWHYSKNFSNIRQSRKVIPKILWNLQTGCV